MSKRFIIDSDPTGGCFSTFQYDPAEDMYILRNGQDCEGIVEANKREFNSDHRRHGDGIGRKVASIPLHIWQELYSKGIMRDRKAFARWLNDLDNRAFRTSPGSI